MSVEGSFKKERNNQKHLLPFLQLLRDVASLIEVGKTFGNGQEPAGTQRDDPR